jgi:hypothetical protein
MSAPAQGAAAEAGAEKRFVVIFRHGVEWSFTATSSELFDAAGAAAKVATIDPKLEPRAVTTTDYLKIVQKWKEGA